LAFGPGREFSQTKISHLCALAAAGLLAVARLTAAWPCLGAETEAASAAVAFADTLVVSAAPAAGPTAPSTASLVTRIDLEQHSGFGDLNDVLGSAAGLQIARLGGWGATAVPSLRGSAPAQIRFFLDGIPLPDAQTGLAGFSRIPLDRLQAIEVHRGVVPAGLGGIGGVGAVNFITREREDGLDATVQAGSFGERAGRVTAGGAAADNSRAAMLMVHGHRADNNFAYVDHNQTFHRDDDDTVRVRENAWVSEWGAWGTGRLTSGNLTTRSSLGYTRRDGGRPGPVGYASPHAGVRYDRVDGQFHLDWAEGQLATDMAAGRANEFLFDPAGEVGFTPPGTTHAVSDDLYCRLAWSPTLVTGVLGMDAGLDWRGQWQTETFNATADPERARKTTSAFAAATLDLAAGRLRLVPAWRWQHTRDDFPGVRAFPWLPVTEGADNRRDDISPSVGAVWTVTPGSAYLEAHAARTVRVPTWTELFGHRGGIDGNRELQPEEISSADLALSLRRGPDASLRVAVYYAATDDKIIFIQNSQRTSKATNLGRTEARGVEAELTLRLNGNVDFSGNVTAQKVEDHGGDPAYRGNSLPFLPDLEAHGRLNAHHGRWRAWLETTHMGGNYRDRANTELDKAPARTLLNLGLGYRWHPAWLGPAGVLTLLGEVMNLTENAVYDVEGFPLPGRSWHLAVRVRR